MHDGFGGDEFRIGSFGSSDWQLGTMLLRVVKQNLQSETL